MATKDDQKRQDEQRQVLSEPAENTEEARKQSSAVLEQQSGAKPEPSQDEADELRRRNITSGNPATYKTR